MADRAPLTEPRLMPATSTETEDRDKGMLRRAHGLAEREHEGQTRKADGRPYLEHVTSVADILADGGLGPDVVTAALLHDAVEHTEVGLGQVADEFGEGIAGLVAAMTDREEIEPWEARKDEHRSRVAASGRDACAIYAADKLEGVREARAGYAEVGEAVQERLGNSLEARIAVWNADVEMIDELRPPLPFADLLRTELSGLLGERAGDGPTPDAS